MDDLVTWLRRQLADDNTKVEREIQTGMGNFFAVGVPITREEFLAHAGPRRNALAEVDAKQRIVDLCAARADLTFIGSELPPGDDTELAAAVLATLALPYADRDGYRDEWRP